MRKASSTLGFMLVMLVGLVIGGIIGDVFQDTLPILAYGRSIGFDPVTIDLSVIKLVLGFTMQINLAAILGLVISLLIFKKL
ncbi:DUF4321 domain-containing protein [Fusibacter sp. JL216-2]|uniref:DUF4321 domain-containing protein n=1 Tax=Fusibacter sp. JL216-2 TaxID=3071453 RepID=UPI003D33FE13